MTFANKKSVAPMFLGNPASEISNQPANAVNEAVLFPVWLAAAFTFDRVHLRTNTNVGNFDFALYDTLFNRIWSLGSTVMTNAVLTVTAQLVPPGSYWLAYALTDIATARFHGTLPAEMPDMVTMAQAAAFPLPASLAPAKAARLVPALTLWKN